MSYSPKELIRVLKDYGFEFKRIKGSHHLFENSHTGKTVVVPVHGNKDLPKALTIQF